MSNLDKLIEAYDNYIKLLVEELDETVSIASVHGWKSKRAELGVMCREEIKLVKEQLQKEEPKTYTQEDLDKAWEEGLEKGYEEGKLGSYIV